MRLYDVLLLALTIVIACTNAVFAEAVMNSVSAFNDEENNHRFLRAAVMKEEEQEERALPLWIKNPNRYMYERKVRRTPNKLNKASKKMTEAATKESKSVTKVFANLNRKYDTNRVDPSALYTKYKFTGRDAASNDPTGKILVQYDNYYRNMMSKYYGKYADNAAPPGAAGVLGAGAPGAAGAARTRGSLKKLAKTHAKKEKAGKRLMLEIENAKKTIAKGLEKNVHPDKMYKDLGLNNPVKYKNQEEALASDVGQLFTQYAKDMANKWKPLDDAGAVLGTGRMGLAKADDVVDDAAKVVKET